MYIYCMKESNYLLFKRGLRLFKGLCLLFLPNVPGAMFIQGGTFIPDSRVPQTLSPFIVSFSVQFMAKFKYCFFAGKFKCFWNSLVLDYIYLYLLNVLKLLPVFEVLPHLVYVWVLSIQTGKLIQQITKQIHFFTNKRSYI